jgi:ribosome biogenesis protein Tsr3
MLRAVILAIGLWSAVALTTSAADNDQKAPTRRRAQLTEEQKTLMKEIREKYDKDKDGKLSPEERKAISQADKERMEKAGITQNQQRRKKEETK